jgi:hypothetical protein
MRESTGILRRARETLALARRGLAEVRGHPASRVAGLHNVVVFGRSVSFVLQTLRGVDEARFDKWYAPWQAEMRADPLLNYFSELRTEILKEGLPPVSASVHIESPEMPRPATSRAFELLVVLPMASRQVRWRSQEGVRRLASLISIGRMTIPSRRPGNP